MSSDRSRFCVRLQDLRVWQGSYDNLLKNDRNWDPNEDRVLDASLSPHRSQQTPTDWDKQIISPLKPFAQLLEEKLAEDVPLEVVNQPKRPFLRKGQGLARFRMKPNAELWRPPRRSNINKKSNPPPKIEDRKITKLNSSSKQPRKSHATQKAPEPANTLKKTNFSLVQSSNKNPNNARTSVHEERHCNEGIVNNKTNELNLLKYLEHSFTQDLRVPDTENYEKNDVINEHFEEGSRPDFSDHLKEQLEALNDMENRFKTDQNVLQSYNAENANLEIDNKKPHSPVDMTPLTVPDFVKSRGIWKNVSSNENKDVDVFNDNEVNHIPLDTNPPQEVDSINLNSDQETTCGSSTIDNILRQLDDEELNGLLSNRNNFLAMKQFLMSQGRSFMVSNSVPEKIFTPAKTNDRPEFHHDSSEKELRIFEVLEKRAENSSFCSTNTSIVNLLSSTPQRHRFFGKNVESCIPEDIPTPYSEQDDSNQYTNIQNKLAGIIEKADVLEDFLQNLKKIDKRKSLRRRHSDSVSSVRQSPAMTFSDEERWSTRSSSPTTTFFESSCQSEPSQRVDMGVNTSFDVLDDTIKENCVGCEELRLKLSKTKKELDETNTENMKLNLTVKDLDKKQTQYDRNIKTMEKRHEREMGKLREEFENERKKFTKEKMVFETYVKEAQNRPNKKEREEITQLKQELADSKELIKLKESKNGATQARLRTQIKHLEKEVSELQATINKLQRENAKLSANQKLNRPRPTEMKMLHEINKNISKLTEETLKKLPAKDENTKTAVKNVDKRKSSDKSLGKENEDRRKCVTPKESKRKSLVEKERKDSTCSDSTAFEMTSLDNLSIEQQYENIFGHFDSPRANTSTSTGEKLERTLEDGTIEIKYSNGNVKIISSDGNVIKVRYFNGDFKETNISEQVIKYHYAESDSWHIQYGDGSEVIEYTDGQKSKKYPDGKIETSYPDGSFRTVYPDGTEEERFADGSTTIKNHLGERIILLPNGQKEVHTKNHKRREYPDGTVRTLYKDGTVETVYANGRRRVKDPNGVLILDTELQES